MKAWIYAFLLLIPVSLYSYTYPQVLNELKSHVDHIASLYAEISIETSGTGEIISQSGNLQYADSFGTTFHLEEPSSIEVIIRNNGEVFINGQKQTSSGSTPQMGDIFLFTLLENFRMEIESEDSNYVYLVGFDKADRYSTEKLVKVWYNKTLKVIDRVKYRGTDYDFPYDMRFQYQLIQGIPIVEKITTTFSVFSATMMSEAVFRNVTIQIK